MKPDAAQATFTALRDVLARNAPRLDVVRDTAEAYALNAAWSEKWKRVVSFGSVEVKKSYVSFHLFPVYMFPDLLAGASPELEARMQGKSCFNFRKPEDVPLAELERLVGAGLKRFEAEGLLRA